MDTPKQIINNVNKDCNVINGPVTGATFILHTPAPGDASTQSPASDPAPETAPSAPVEEARIPEPPADARAQAIRKSLAELMEIKDGNRTLFTRKGHWVAVYRVLADAQIVRDSYKDFADFIADKMPENLQTPFSYETLKKTVIDSGLYHRPLSDWDNNPHYDIPHRSYTTMRQIAYTFREILKRNGGV